MAASIYRELEGRLMRVRLDQMSGYNYEIWFPYTREMMQRLKPGDLLVVPNFAGDPSSERLSVLESIQIMPSHYAIGDDLEGYPGFLDEAAQSASEDWKQENSPTQETTKIRCMAIPTGIELRIPNPPPASGKKYETLQESTMPMPFREAKLLSSEVVGEIYNKGIDADYVVLGALTRDKTVSIRARPEELIKTHLGVFGYTGTGKSNLVSTLVSSLLAAPGESKKVVIFDLMGEYLGLLLDELISDDPKRFGQLVVLGTNSLPGPVMDYLLKKGDKDKAVEALAKHLLLPKGLKPRKDEFKPGVRRLLEGNRIKLYVGQGGETLKDVYEASIVPGFLTDGRRSGEARESMKKWVTKYVTPKLDSDITSKEAKKLADELEAKVDELHEKAQETANSFIETLRNVGSADEGIPSEVKTQVPRIGGEINKPDRNSLFVVTGAEPDFIRKFSSWLSNNVYDGRRRTGDITPLTLFVFDEADEFIPGDGKEETYKASLQAVEMLARRGRKFGLGVCISTQRVTYLNTSIMAQPHTYFVSRLPRESDRERVTQAFGLSEDMLRETFRFGKGDWLVVSHEATGLQGVPIPIHAYNAEDRIRRVLLGDKD